MSLNFINQNPHCIHTNPPNLNETLFIQQLLSYPNGEESHFSLLALGIQEKIIFHI